jgi:leukotriene-A4 hydrolase
MMFTARRLSGQDPDDAFSSIPYEKGCFFLLYLQGVVGGPEPMEEFARAYFSHVRARMAHGDRLADARCSLRTRR